jgi:hypothetical protein
VTAGCVSNLCASRVISSLSAPYIHRQPLVLCPSPSVVFTSVFYSISILIAGDSGPFSSSARSSLCFSISGCRSRCFLFCHGDFPLHPPESPICVSFSSSPTVLLLFGILTSLSCYKPLTDAVKFQMPRIRSTAVVFEKDVD